MVPVQLSSTRRRPTALYGSAHGEPVLHRDFPARDGDEASDPGLAGQEIVVGAVQAAVGDVEADGEEFALDVIQEAHVDGLGQLPHVLEESLGKSQHFTRQPFERSNAWTTRSIHSKKGCAAGEGSRRIDRRIRMLPIVREQGSSAMGRARNPGGWRRELPRPAGRAPPPSSHRGSRSSPDTCPRCPARPGPGSASALPSRRSPPPGRPFRLLCPPGHRHCPLPAAAGEALK